MGTSHNEHYEFIPKLIQKRGFRRIAEIGVLDGELTERIAALDCVEYLLSVDSYAPRSDGQHRDDEYRATLKRLRANPHTATKVELLRKDSVDAACCVPQGFFDFVFLDAGHFFTDVWCDISLWRLNVASSGLLAGHDWGPKWPGVEIAVRQFWEMEHIHLEQGCWFVEHPYWTDNQGGD